jgi:ABC-2 type transport system ATP-binding protein
LSAGVDAGAGLATTVVRALDAAGVLVDNIEVRQPSLDDVFFSLTGGHIEKEEFRDADAEKGGDSRLESAGEDSADARNGPVRGDQTELQGANVP